MTQSTRQTPYFSLRRGSRRRLDILTSRGDSKVVVVGDGECGKTCMLMSQTGENFKWDYTPTVFDNFTSNITVDKKLVSLSLWDTAGQEDYDRLRPLSYQDTDLVIIVFAISRWDSYDDWEPEIKHFLPGVPVMLVGTKRDMRDDFFIPSGYANCVTVEDGEKLKLKIGASHYFECSARKGEGVKEIFTECAKVLLKSNKKRKRQRHANDKCSIL